MTVIDSLLLVGMVISLVASLLLAVIVSVSHTKRPVRYSFVWTLVASALWTGSNLIFQISGASGDIGYAAALLAYTFGGWTAIAFTYFIMKFTDWNHAKSTVDVAFILLSIGVIAFAKPGFIATGLSDGRIITTGWIVLYGLVVVSSLFIAAARLMVSYRSSSGRLHRQVEGMIWSLCTAAVLAIIFNLILPMTGIYKFVALGPTSMTLFIAIASYLILALGLFGVRSIAAKVVTFLLTVIALAAIGFLLMLVLFLLGIITHIPIGTYLIIVTILLIITAVFQPVQHSLRHLTDKMFYRNSYDADKFEKELNTIMLANVKVNEILNKAAEIIEATLKSSSVTFLLCADESENNVYGANKQLSNHEIEIVNQCFENNKEDIAIMDEISSTNPIRQVGYSKNIDVIIRLRSKSDNPQINTMGYMLVGERQNGASYYDRDVSALVVAAHLVSLAVENAQYYEQINLFNQRLKDEVNSATASLRSANRKLKKLYKAEDDFIAMASHQLRTPLTSIRGYLSMLLEGDFGKVTDEQRHVLSDVYTSSERMVFLISDFLDVSRLQTGKFELQRAPMRLDEILTPEIQQMQIPAELRQIKIDYTAPTNLPLINGDRDKLRQVMINMIDNAIFYSHAGGHAIISLHKRAGQVIFTVRDTGIGVPRVEQPKLFTKFFRASNARNIRPDGTGVGLFMVRKVIVAHGGSLIFESKEGEGSTFGFRLPIISESVN